MLVHQRVNPIKVPLNHHFPMVFLWFSYGFPMIFPWFTIHIPRPFFWGVVLYLSQWTKASRSPPPWDARKTRSPSGRRAHQAIQHGRQHAMPLGHQLVLAALNPNPREKKKDRSYHGFKKKGFNMENVFSICLMSSFIFMGVYIYIYIYICIYTHIDTYRI